MSKGYKIVLSVMAAFVAITILHAWLNIGFDKLGIGAEQGQASFRVGFLPVT